MTGKPRGERSKKITSDVLSAFETGRQAIEELKSEIEDWKDSLSSNNMEYLPKYEALEECFGDLEATLGYLESIEVPEFLEETEVVYTQDTRTSAQSRNSRLSNALNALDTVKDAAEAWMNENRDLDESASTKEDVDIRESERCSVDEFINDMDTVISNANDISFPGLF